MFENKKIKDVHATRYIASWLKVGGKLGTWKDFGNFEDWLVSEGLSESDIKQITTLATCGRMELESSARRFIKQLNTCRSCSKCFACMNSLILPHSQRGQVWVGQNFVLVFPWHLMEKPK